MRSGDSIADREPCPWRIVDDIGGAFSMGAIGGGIFHVIKGSWNAPKGARIKGSLNACSARGPILGGQFAVWGGLFACCDCSLTAIRQKEDPWNSIISGAATGGILAARAGPKAVASAAVVGGTLLALIEGFGIMITKMMAPPVPGPEELAQMGAMDPTAPPTAGGLMSSTAPPQQSSAAEQPSSNSSSGMNPFEQLLSGGGNSSTPTNDEGNFNSFGSDTKFSTGSSSEENSSDKPSKSGWWPFGANN
mmetsp:Transcript_1126/g.1039  ORF Transcript_1126/g.1039 Transcript_1126/m.1039 type:complete len:249 (-) Transcript_1126:499-1245(-)|eukprot:CAMPEP_0197828250 /NCGR_PEP_ID=MMETSP1437-20131217/4866_1 /TAXON_ID=49252 ORGANISM="Eucampia antarctica, Strain CCMP1452" /NCGR_SAMPLE_ID=MMETSP1437 /ASSEMBLY_ACC=CAM_ASM_001096 /LENGTH=248 /DNA_ID=CAMNT_0043429415 /DNA_START=231 /DNA_END=977 /DNA_ORIENTATION=+